MKLDMNLLRPVFQGIESKDPMVANAWNETLLGVITFLTEDAIKIEASKKRVGLGRQSISPKAVQAVGPGEQQMRRNPLKKHQYSRRTFYALHGIGL